MGGYIGMLRDYRRIQRPKYLGPKTLFLVRVRAGHSGTWSAAKFEFFAKFGWSRLGKEEAFTVAAAQQT